MPFHNDGGHQLGPIKKPARGRSPRAGLKVILSAVRTRDIGCRAVENYHKIEASTNNTLEQTASWSQFEIALHKIERYPHLELILEGVLSMTYSSAGKTMFDLLNIKRKSMFRFSNILWPRKSDPTPVPSEWTGRTKVSSAARSGMVLLQWPWPLTARVPIVSGALMLAVAIAVSRVLMSSVAHEQELGVRQIAAVYLDGISTTVYPHVVARNLANTTEAGWDEGDEGTDHPQAVGEKEQSHTDVDADRDECEAEAGRIRET